MKRRNKAYKPRIVTIPKLIPIQMVTDELPLLAPQLHAAVMTVIERPSCEACNNLSRQLTVIAAGISYKVGGSVRGTAEGIPLQSAILAVEAIVDRHERTGVVAVSEQEAATLRAAAGALDGVLCNMSVTAYQWAERDVMRAVGL